MEYNREDQFSLDRLINRANAAEGTSLPPQQRGFFRVPFVSSVKVSSPSPTKYIVSWQEPEGFTGKISGYNVYYSASGDIREPIFVTAASKSPATVRLLLPSGTRITFFVQTQLNSGFVNNPAYSPTATIPAA